MPWRVGKSSKCGSSKPWGVFKKGSSSPEYCHATEDGAMSQVRALYANTDEGKALTKEGSSEIDSDMLMAEVKEGVDAKGYYYGGYVGGVTSFADLDSARENQEKLHETWRLNDDFSMLSNNILYSDDISDKATALTTLANEYAQRVNQAVKEKEAQELDEGPNISLIVDGEEIEKGHGIWHRLRVLFGKGDVTKEVNGDNLTRGDFAFAPNHKDPATWKIQISKHGDTDLTMLGKALTELSCHAKEYGMTEEEQRNVTDKILSQVEFIFEERGDKEGSSLSVWKEASGQYRWSAIYSNNMLDQDNPPETILDQSHKAFTYLVKEGEVPYPELWHWHIPGTRWGVADFLDYRDGFALAGGTVDPGCEKEAEVLAGRTGIKVSHGMPKAVIVRDPENPSNIVFHLTKEISDLPDYAAANQATTFKVEQISKEASMPSIADVIKEKTDYLKGLGYSDAQIEEVRARLGGNVKKEKGDDLHEKNGDEASAEASANDTSTPAGDAAPVNAELQAQIDAAKNQLAEVQTTLTAAQAEITGLVKEVKDIVTDLKVIRDVQAASVKEGTPRESASFIETMLTKGSPIGSAEARVDGRSALAKGPKEKETGVPQVTGIPILDQAFAGMTPQQQ